MNIYIFESLSSSDKYYQETGYLTRYATIRHELGTCVHNLGTHLSKEIAFTF